MKNILQTIKIIVFAAVLTVGMGYVMADWTPPVNSPPTCTSGTPGCDAPIHVGRFGQTKDGNLIIQGLTPGGAAATNGLIVSNGRVGIGLTNPTQKLEVNGNAKATQFCLPGTAPTGGCITVWPTGGGSGGIGGSGTANYLPKFTAATTLGDSKVYQSPTTNHVGINTTAPDATAWLDVNGRIRIRGGSPSIGKFLVAEDTSGRGTWESLTTWQSPTLSIAYNESPVPGNSGSNPITSNLGASGEYDFCAISRIDHDGKNSAACRVVKNSGSQWQLQVWKNPAGDGGIICNAMCFKFE